MGLTFALASCHHFQDLPTLQLDLSMSMSMSIADPQHSAPTDSRAGNLISLTSSLLVPRQVSGAGQQAHAAGGTGRSPEPAIPAGQRGLHPPVPAHRDVCAAHGGGQVQAQRLCQGGLAHAVGEVRHLYTLLDCRLCLCKRVADAGLCKCPNGQQMQLCWCEMQRSCREGCGLVGIRAGTQAISACHV